MEVHLDDRAIDAIFRNVDQCHLPGAAVGISINGTPLYRRGFGLANMDAPYVLTPTTRLRVGSVTKQFTCLAYLLLCEAGDVGIDDPIGRFIPEVHPITRRVTMRQLMGHTSGARDAYLIFTLFNEPYLHNALVAQSVSSSDLLKLYHEIDDVDALPNTAWIYNNGGYLLLSVAIERISNQTLGDFLQRRILEPIGMHDSFLSLSDSHYTSSRGGQHVVNPDGGYEVLHWGLDNYSGGGALVSTVDDLLRWLAHMARPVVCRPDTVELMKQPQKLENGFSTGYGLGLQVSSYRGHQLISHTGNALGGGAEVVAIPEAGLDIVILVNRQDIWCSTLTRRVLDACVPGIQTSGRKAAVTYAEGTFQSPTSGIVVQLSREIQRNVGSDTRQMVSVDGRDIPFRQGSGAVLLCDDGFEEGRQCVTLLGDGKHPDSIVLDDLGRSDELIRVPPTSATDLPTLVGRYQADAIHTEAIVSSADTGFQLKMIGSFGSVVYELRHIGSLLFRAIPPIGSRAGFLGGLVSFDRSGQTMRFSLYRMRSLVFCRSTYP